MVRRVDREEEGLKSTHEFSASTFSREFTAGSDMQNNGVRTDYKVTIATRGSTKEVGTSTGTAKSNTRAREEYEEVSHQIGRRWMSIIELSTAESMR